MTHQKVDHDGWYSRNYLPHFHTVGLIQMLTFRLADSMPAAKVHHWQLLLEHRDDPELFAKVEKYLDAGYGACILGEPTAAKIVEDALLHFDGDRYRLLSWVIMPNHVHVLVETIADHSPTQLAHSWKSFTAKEINKALGRTGILWQPEVFDRFMRGELHLQYCADYIHRNPVKAGFVTKAQDWLFGSARRR